MSWRVYASSVTGCGHQQIKPSVGDGTAALICGAGQHFPLSENGEYANQTWFLTSPGWRERLHISRFTGQVTPQRILSEGVLPFVLVRHDEALLSRFMIPVVRYLYQLGEAVGCVTICAIPGNPRTRVITDNGKTPLVAL